MPLLIGEAIEIQVEAVARRLIQECWLGAGEQSGSFVDLVERVRADHEGRGSGAVDDRLGKSEQRLPCAVHRQDLGGAIEPRQAVSHPEPGGHGVAQPIESARRRVDRQFVEMIGKRPPNLFGRRMLRLAD